MRLLGIAAAAGKGTTVANLQEKLPQAVTWSNGNIFRSLTLLAVTWCELFNLPDFEPEQALTAQNLAGFMKMMRCERPPPPLPPVWCPLHFPRAHTARPLPPTQPPPNPRALPPIVTLFARAPPRPLPSFGKFNGKWDIQVKGLGLDFLVSEVSNTLLKAPKVGKHIPTVAERTQGEVVGFAAGATRAMGEDGLIVLLEGRQQTVDYVPTPFRYTLTMSDTTVLGQRRAAQRLGAETLKALPKPALEAKTEETTGCGWGRGGGGAVGCGRLLVPPVRRRPTKINGVSQRRAVAHASFCPLHRRLGMTAVVRSAVLFLRLCVCVCRIIC